MQEQSYLNTPFLPMLRHRAGWLCLMFIGEMVTASAMARYEDQIARAIVLAVFIPLIISTGGNSGTQAATLIVRALSTGEVTPNDWRFILRREVGQGAFLGVLLALVGFARIWIWETTFHAYGDHFSVVAATVVTTIVLVVAWGAMLGSMLPLLLYRAKVDPANACAPLVTTLIDVSGLILYFTLAGIFLGPVISGT